MKFRLTNFDSSEYKQFENMLNELSKQGYNCNSVDLFTFFKHDNQRYFYKTDIFIYDKTNKETKPAQKKKWLSKYANYGYEYIGKTKKIHVFKAKKPNKLRGTDEQLLLKYFKRSKTILNAILVFVAMFLSFFLIPNVFLNMDPQEFMTNGTVILHYVPLLFCLALLCRFFIQYLTTEKIKIILTNKKQPNYTSNFPFIVANWLLISSIFLIGLGFGLDFIERKEMPLNNRIITLSDLNIENSHNNFNTYVTSSSIIINESISYYENNGTDAIKVNYYRYANNDKAANALDDYLETLKNEKKQITGGYLLASDSIYNSIVFTKEEQLIVIQTTIDLLKDNTYQLITEFNYKSA